MQDDKKAPNWLTRLARVRMADWVIAAALLTMVVWLMAPQQLPVSIYKLSLVSMAAVAGYWIDRSLFPYARPDGQLARELLEAQLPEAVPLEPSPLEAYMADPVDCGTDDACALAEAVDCTSVHLLIGAMLRRALIVSAAMLAVSLGA